MNTSLKYIAIPLVGLGLLSFANVGPAAAQNVPPPAPANASPSTPDTSVPAVVAPPSSPKVPSGIGQGTKNEASHMGTLAAEDAEFVRKAAMGGLAEVASGKLAERSGNQEVKQFGQKIVDDHTKANQELATIAQSKGVILPTTLEADERTKIEKLDGMRGHDFDRQFMTDMVADHQKAIAMFQKEADASKDAEIKQFAQETPAGAEGAPIDGARDLAEDGVELASYVPPAPARAAGGTSYGSDVKALTAAASPLLIRIGEAEA